MNVSIVFSTVLFAVLRRRCIASGPTTRDISHFKPLEPHKQVDVLKFMKTYQEAIWTTYGTLRDECIYCKFDRLLDIRGDDIWFWRNYSREEARMMKEFKGTLHTRSGQHHPFEMRLQVIKEEIEIGGLQYTVQGKFGGHTEVLLYAEDNNSCGVFANNVRTFEYDHENEIFYKIADETSCEIRVKAPFQQRPPEPSRECMKQFKKYCPIGPYYSLFNELCDLPMYLG